MMTTRTAQEEVDDAAAQLLIELAFLLPRGTLVSKHPIAEKLQAYVAAIVRRERETSHK